jgi:hypothetical protein
MTLKSLKNGVLKVDIRRGCLLIESTLTEITALKIADGLLRKNRQIIVEILFILSITGNEKRLANGLMRLV